MKNLERFKKQPNGFTLVEVIIALALVSIFAIMVVNYTSILGKHSNINRSNNTKNRILSSIRDLAGMPASLRVSMRASSGGVAVNPKLLACAGGNPIDNCNTGEIVGFTLFSPLIQRNPTTGAVQGTLPPMSAPFGTTQTARVNTFGAPCPPGSPASPACPLLVYTSFKAQCGPAPLLGPPPATITTELLPQKKCTVADVIEVTYYIKLDPSLANTDPELQSFVTNVTGTVVVPVVKISGNVPQ